MKEVVHIIALSSKEYDWLRSQCIRNEIGPQGNKRETIDDEMTKNIKDALEAEKIGFINEKAEITATIRLF